MKRGSKMQEKRKSESMREMQKVKRRKHEREKGCIYGKIRSKKKVRKRKLER